MVMKMRTAVGGGEPGTSRPRRRIPAGEVLDAFAAGGAPLILTWYAFALSAVGLIFFAPALALTTADATRIARTTRFIAFTPSATEPPLTGRPDGQPIRCFQHCEQPRQSQGLRQARRLFRVKYVRVIGWGM